MGVRRNSNVLLAAVLVAGSFVIGYATGKYEGGAQRESAVRNIPVVNRNVAAPLSAEEVNFGLYWDVWSLIERDYLRQPVDESQLLYGSLAGMVDGLEDPYSAFFNPQRAQMFREDLSGQLE
ncbi:MAG: hypothetical protein ABIG71_02925, partial [Candidatus Uhrbacteria bacterium]